MNYDKRWFRPVGGLAGETGRVAVYHQDGELLRGEFIGGGTRRGVLAGTVAPDGRLTFGYCMVLDTGEVICGRCRSTPEILSDGRIRLHEEWERFGAHAGTGSSRIEEIPSDQTRRGRR